MLSEHQRKVIDCTPQAQWLATPVWIRDPVRPHCPRSPGTWDAHLCPDGYCARSLAGSSLMSSKTTAPSIESASALVTPPANAKTAMPADIPAVTPETLSSTTAHRSGGCAHLVRSEQEDVGGWLAVRHLVDAEDPAIEAIEESGLAQGEPHLVVTSARCHTHGSGDLIECLDDARNGDKLSLEHFPVARLELSVPVNATAQMSFDLLVHVGSRAPNEPLDDVGFRQRPPEARQDLRFRPHGEPLAVHEDTVAVEDHQVEVAHPDEITDPGSGARTSR